MGIFGKKKLSQAQISSRIRTIQTRNKALENKIRSFERRHKGKGRVEKFVKAFAVGLTDVAEELADNKVILRNLKRMKKR